MKTKKTVIPVILSADNNYAPYMYVTMFSILENAAPGTFYDFFLMVPSAFSAENTTKINSLKNKYKCDIHFLDMKDAFSDLKMQIQHITSPTYYRLLAGDLLPKNYAKCIYLDVDIVVCQDLAELFNINLRDNYVAGVRAAAYFDKAAENANRLGLPNIDNYINAGMMIMNLKKIRKDNMTAKFMDLTKNNYSSQDQDVVNVACHGKIKILPLKYNFMTKYIGRFDTISANVYPVDEIQEAQKNPTIIHYADKIKPWQQIRTSYDKIWWNYAKDYKNIPNTLSGSSAKIVRRFYLFGFVPLFSIQQQST